MESIKGYDDYKGASPIDDGFIEVSSCYYCGIEDSDDVVLVNERDTDEANHNNKAYRKDIL